MMTSNLLSYNDWMEAVSKNGYKLKEVPSKFKDKNMIKSAVQSAGLALEFAGAVFQNDKEVVLDAVTETGDAYQFASPRLKEDKEVLFRATAKDSYPFQFAKKLQKDESVVEQLIEKDPNALRFAAQFCRRSVRIAKALLVKHKEHFEHLNGDLRKQPEILLLALKNNDKDHNNKILRYVPTALQKEIHYTALEHKCDAKEALYILYPSLRKKQLTPTLIPASINFKLAMWGCATASPGKNLEKLDENKKESEIFTKFSR